MPQSLASTALAVGACATGKLAQHWIGSGLAPRRAGRVALAGLMPSRPQAQRGAAAGVASQSRPNPCWSSSPIHVLAACTEYRQETVILQRSAEKNGFSFRALGVGKPWGVFSTKLLHYDEALKKLVGAEIAPGDTVLLVDAWDCVVLGSADELRRKLEGFPRDTVLCGSESVCGPNHFLTGRIEKLFPDGATPWRYPNSGGLCATAEVMAALLHGLVWDRPDGGKLPAAENDQVWLHEFLLQRASRRDPFPVILDTECHVFQCMYEEEPRWDYEYRRNGPAWPAPRIVNRMTRARPVIAHGNGHTGRWFLSALIGELRLMQHLGLRDEELRHLKHEGPVPPGTPLTEELIQEYAPWWYQEGIHAGALDGFQTFRMVRDLQREPQAEEPPA